jgi:flavin-dependent dehydrogenase
LNIKIAGAGISGSYLGRLLESEATIYDDNLRPGCRCAWGAPRSQIANLLEKVNFNISDFVITDVVGAYQNKVYIPLNNFVVIDKPKLVTELRRGQKLVNSRVDFSVERDGLIVNATAMPRAVEVFSLDSLQERVTITGAEGRTVYGYINPSYTGYAWLFPLDDEGRLFHHGAACKGTEPKRLMDELLSYYGFKKNGFLCNCEGPLYLADPMETEIVESSVVAVGGAAGCVHPVTGEGILTSMQSAWLLAETFKNNDPLTEYEQKVRELLAGYRSSYRVFRLMLQSPPIAWTTGIFDMFRSIENYEPDISLRSALLLLYRIIWNLFSPPRIMTAR